MPVGRGSVIWSPGHWGQAPLTIIRTASTRSGSSCLYASFLLNSLNSPRIPPARSLIDTRSTGTSPPRPTTKSPRFPGLHRPAPLNIHNNPTAVDTLGVSILVGCFHVFLVGVLDECVAFELSCHRVVDHFDLGYLSVDLEFSLQLTLCQIICLFIKLGEYNE